MKGYIFLFFYNGFGRMFHIQKNCGYCLFYSRS